MRGTYLAIVGLYALVGVLLVQWGCGALPAVVATIDAAARMADLARRVCNPDDPDSICAAKCAAATTPPSSPSSSAPAPSSSSSSSSAPRAPAVVVPPEPPPSPMPTSTVVWL